MPQGAFDHEATAFVQLPSEDQLRAAPLEAPGHGFVPPMILPLTPVADPQIPPQARLPHDGGTVPGHVPGGWPEPESGTVPHPDDPHATGQWAFQEVVDQRGPAAPSDVTGQWTIPVARGDLPEETGEYTTAMLRAQQWNAPPAPSGHSMTEPHPGLHPELHPDLHPEAPQAAAAAPWAPSDAPATLPGGAAAPWAAHPVAEPVAQPHTEPAERIEPVVPVVPVAPVEQAAPVVPVVPVVPVASVEPVEEAAPAEPVEHAEAVAPVVERPAPHPEHPPVADAPADVADPGHEAEPVADSEPEPEAVAAEPAELVATEATEAPDASADVADPEPEPAADTAPEPEPESEPESEPEPEVPFVPAFEEHPPTSYVLRVNGTDRPVTDAWIGESLLYVLRERLGLAGAKDGCSQGECGACNVQVDGRLVASCLVPAATAAGTEVRTVEGLAEHGEPSDVQRALARNCAVQCGFCIPGMAMTVHDLLEGNHSPTELETRQALCGNLCRCSGYRGVLDAVDQVVAEREASAAAAEADPGQHRPGGPPVPGAPVPEARIPHQAPPGAGSVQPHPHDGGMA
ncbi:2Fe-2S iron-sulfur cluster-binding protein [Streptomyces sp. NPDC058953]|uniref:(2Fe-2S)-binding protein n=1 Tax=unclassified Streptomyces TaxID=2593676 RepID=UPI00368BDA35